MNSDSRTSRPGLHRSYTHYLLSKDQRFNFVYVLPPNIRRLFPISYPETENEFGHIADLLYQLYQTCHFAVICHQVHPLGTNVLDFEGKS